MVRKDRKGVKSLVCREKLIIRKPYHRFEACLNTVKKVMEDVFPNPEFVDDILESEAKNYVGKDWKCDWFERVPKECEGLTVEECILKTGEFELKEWCFNEHSYKYGVEVDCGSGKIYVFYCEER